MSVYALEEEAEPPPLPQPLRLEDALRLYEEHPELRRQQSLMEKAAAETRKAEALDDWSLDFKGRLLWIEPSPRAPDDGRADHTAGLYALKPLYDFGRQSAQEQAAREQYAARAQLFIQTKAQRRIEVMRAFFDVILADLEYAFYNETLAMSYIQFDRKRQRRDLGQASDLDVARLEHAYQQVMQKRRRVQNTQRSGRARLANLLNRPGQLPANLETPPMPNFPALPEVEEAQRQAARNNPRIRALRAALSAARSEAAAARAQKRPVLNALAELNYWEKEFGSRDRARAGVELQVPLYSGGRVSAALAQAQAAAQSAQAELETALLQVRQDVLETWLRIQALEGEKEALKALTALRDLESDFSRTVYQLEFQSDLGNAMIGQSEVNLRRAEHQFNLSLAWEEFRALLGN